jgi:acetylornithine deacetylase/succinyl-diaminopimelate desuccinylase-like protein
LTDTAKARALVQRLAEDPRGAGTAGEARAREFCAEGLRGLGFKVREHVFTYSQFPAVWGLPMAGTFLMLVGVALVLWSGEGHGGWPQGFATLATLLVLAFWLWFAFTVIRGRAFTDSGIAPVTGVNLVATRGSEEPRLWLCAHLDTKSQPFPTLARTVGVFLAIGVTIALVGFYFVGAIVADTPDIWMALGIASTVAALPLLASTVGNGSTGALDNASGVVAALLAASETGDAELGVLLTTAEEMGLAGARAWARSRAAAGERPPALVLNCDTVDDGGTMRCVFHRREHRALAQRVRDVAAGAGIEVKLTRHTPGIFVDSSSLANAGLPAVTLSRVTLGTLARIHTKRDAAEHVTGAGARDAAAILAAVVLAEG